MLEVKHLLNRIAPEFLEELEGLAEGMRWPLYDVLHEYSGYQGNKVRAGCSSVMQNGMYIRNYDYYPKTYEGRFVFLNPKGRFATAGFAQRATGRTDGMNSRGFAAGYHFVNRIKPADGLVCSTICRILLEQCSSTTEAIALLKELPHRHAFNYSLYDSQGHAAVVEASARGTVVRKTRSNYCTNHFISNELSKENCHYLKDSYRREKRLAEIDWSTHTEAAAFQRFNHSTDEIYSNQYSNWSGTMHTALYSTEKQIILVGIGGDRTPVVLYIKKWAEGERIFLSKIKGKLDTTISVPFNW
ncbi:C45 family autoproteolytic acyltransferase/hydolase [Alteribacillus sp. HJP-4]|uniref:C45 family autoproteolytic acyltransferase/hydolase n=1 Tax=Alteribacillus sp. HJP-4 TaxID=2775394 RepID=UPI0035CD1DC5